MKFRHPRYGVIELSQQGPMHSWACEKKLTLIPGATHLCGTLQQTGNSAAD